MADNLNTTTTAGEDVTTETQDTTQVTAETTTEENAAAETEVENDGAQTEAVTKIMTQAEIDALVQKTLARGKRLGAKEAAQKTKAQEPAETEDKSAELEAKMQKANDRLLRGTIREVSSDLKITANGVKLASKVCDFTDCFDEKGDLDDEDVKDVLKQFVEDYPEFAEKAQAAGSTPFAAGSGGKTTSQADLLKNAFGLK